MKREGRDVQESGSERPIGYTVGENSSDRFTFVVSDISDISKWEYVFASIGSRKVIGRIEKVVSRSDLLNQDMDFVSVKKYVETELADQVFLCQTKSLGSVEGDSLLLSRKIIPPGSPVWRASQELLERHLSYPEERSLHIGHLVDRNDVRISVDINGLKRHLAILAQTGAGKSNAAAVLMEELLKKGASIIVLDPHADYALMRTGKGGAKYASDVMIFRTPLSNGRYSSQVGAISSLFTLRFQDLEPDEISDIMGIKEEWSTLRRIVDDIYISMKPPRDLASFISAYKEIKGEDASKISGRIRILTKISSIFSDSTTPMEEYLSPGQLSILDLSGMDQALSNYFAHRVLNTIYESKMEAYTGFPVFVFVEEAHNFVPPASRTLIAQILRKIASEGRKFGMFLVVISQRPGKLDQDVLSQCNSAIILRITNPLDQKAIMESSESISESMLQDLPSLNIGEAVLTGEFVRIPVIATIRKRETAEGGGDIDLISLLKDARKIRDKRKNPSEFKKSLKEEW
jgi:DNA helicase HerA-like ATPase